MRFPLLSKLILSASFLTSVCVLAFIPQEPRFIIWGDIDVSTEPHGAPEAQYIQSFSVYLLAFWTSGEGPADNALKWTYHSDESKRAFAKRYHDAGIRIGVSAFGESDAPQALNSDPTSMARRLAAFVKTNHLDGVDIDYEEFDTMESGEAEEWLATLTRVLRQELPRPRYFITHSPIAPWFNGEDYPGGAYEEVHRLVGKHIDWYNVQYYNQGSNQYLTCQSILWSSQGTYPGTSIFEIHENAGVPLSKLVIGKPAKPVDASNGYIRDNRFNSCLKQAVPNGWKAGAAWWQAPHMSPARLWVVRRGIL